MINKLKLFLIKVLKGRFFVHLKPVSAISLKHTLRCNSPKFFRCLKLMMFQIDHTTGQFSTYFLLCLIYKEALNIFRASHLTLLWDVFNATTTRIY